MPPIRFKRCFVWSARPDSGVLCHPAEPHLFRQVGQRHRLFPQGHSGRAGTGLGVGDPDSVPRSPAQLVAEVGGTHRDGYGGGFTRHRAQFAGCPHRCGGDGTVTAVAAVIRAGA
jgi:hypothetical protein